MFIEYPKMLYKASGEHVVVADAEEENAMRRDGWGMQDDSTPSAAVLDEPEKEPDAESPLEMPYKEWRLRALDKATLLDLTTKHGLEFAPEEVTRDELIGILMDLNP